MTSEFEPALQACPGCAAPIDVSEQEPFEQVQCPVCRLVFRARTQFNNFTLIDVLGSGGMGAVYRAQDRTLNRYVALKVVRKEYSNDPTHLAQFEREAQITASVSHPHVVKVFSYGHDHGSFYIAMELVSKGSLDEMMAAQTRLPEAVVLRIGSQIAQGLQAAHHAGLIHRDIKPGNILFADLNTAKIVDFGLATVFEKEAESRGEIWGTPYYVPPERLKNEPEDFRSDIYSLGATLFHAIAGRPPFEANNASVAALRHLKSNAVSLHAAAPDVSDATAVVIDRMLKQNPNDRFQNYDELIELLSYARSQIAAGPVRVRAVSRPTPVKSSSLWPSLGVAALVAAGAIGSFFYFQGGAQAPVNPPPVVQKSSADERLMGEYNSALKRFFARDYKGAVAAFSEIEDSPSIKPLMLRWVLFHKGFAQLLGENFRESESSFAALSQAGPYSDEPEEKRRAQFFIETGHLASLPSLEPESIKWKERTNAYDHLQQLILGVKFWRLGKRTEAGPFLEAFNGRFPEGEDQPYARIVDYRSIANRYLKEYAALVDGDDSPRKEEGQPNGVAAEEAFPAAPTDPTAAASSAEANPGGAGGPKASAEDLQLKSDLELLKKDQEKIVAEMLAYRFGAARRMAAGINVKAEEALKKRDKLVQIAGWLEGFKQTLIADLNRQGYPFPIKAASRSTLDGGIGGGTDSEIRLKTPYGSIPILWEKISPDSVIEMASYFLRKERDPAGLGQRKWQLGLYACQFGRAKYGRPILEELAPSRSEYSDSLDVILAISR